MITIPTGSGFGLENVPFGSALIDGRPTLVTRIGDLVIPVGALAGAGLVPVLEIYVRDLDTLVEQGKEVLRSVRQAIIEWAKDGAPGEIPVYPADSVKMLRPVKPKAFIDFYSGIYHASNVGRMFRPDQPPLLPNYRHLPVGYNGRASSVFGSETPIFRPNGQTRVGENAPTFGPTKEMDFELEVGFVTCRSTAPGQCIPIADCEDAMAGLLLVNDWSARDVQRWEYQPLGPFLAKSFATSASPWLVSFDALDLVRIPGPVQDPEVLPHLTPPANGHFDIQLEVLLQTPQMSKPQVICQSNTKHLYWSFAQQLAHQSSNGTPIEAGDLYASGTISGPEDGQFGSMLELTWRGTKPITLEETGETRTFLLDGDTITFRAFAARDGVRIDFGEVRNTVVASC